MTGQEHGADPRLELWQRTTREAAEQWRLCAVPGHDWNWLGNVHLTLDRAGNVTRYDNAECARCGLRAWLHGHAPTTGPLTRSTNPTTERS